MRILVTGGLGYIGQAVTRDLVADGHEVSVLSRGRNEKQVADGAELVEGDLRDRERIGQILTEGPSGFAFVCHLAGLAQGRESVQEPLRYWDVNVGGTINLLSALAPGTRMVFASTNVVYGSRNVGALSEDLDPHPESPYAQSKLACEQLIAAQAATDAIGAISLRIFNVAGAVDGVGDVDETRIVPNALRAATGELPHVTLNGDGSAARDFVHVADVARAVRLALRAASPGQHRVYNVGSGQGSAMRDVIRTAGQVTGMPVSVKEMPPKPEPHTLVADNALIGRELGWHPMRSSLDEIVSDAWSAWSRPAPWPRP